MAIIELAKGNDRALWESFLLENKLCHHAYNWSWQYIIKNVFKHKPFYLIAKEGNKLSGIAPLFNVKSKLFGNSLISIPYLNAGGIIANNEDVKEKLLEEVYKIAEETKASYVELRHSKEVHFSDPNITSRSHKVSMQIELQKNPEELFNSFPPKLRSQIRRPSKSGMYAEVFCENNANFKAINAFYKVFSEHMRDLGTPVYPKKLFSETINILGKKCKTIIIWFENIPVAAAITINEGNCTEIPWASSLRKYNTQSPNMLLYWEAIKHACFDGQEIFDFGRSSPDSGPYRFKTQWGAKPIPLHWYYKVFSGIAPDVNPNNPKYNFMVNCWKKLPLSIANIIGPIITKGIP